MIRFSKVQGIGNDFVMVDTIRDPLNGHDLPLLARQMCDRRFGVGSDGLILAMKGENAPFKMRMFNPDGSEAEMCGNGIRCMAKLVHDHGHLNDSTIPIETGAGLLTLELQSDGQVRVDMGPALLSRGEIPVEGDPEATFVSQQIEADNQSFLGTAVSMGNPHVVFFVDDVASVPLEKWGPMIERHPLFPNRTNVHFAQIVDRKHLLQRTWERGAGITLACGTGACACGVAAFLNGLADRDVEIRLPGGNLAIEYEESGHVFMTGPAVTTFEGEWPD